MNLFGRSTAAFSVRLGGAVVALLLASSGSLYAQHDKDKERKSTPPTRQSSHQASPQPSRQTPQASTPHTQPTYHPPQGQPSGGTITRQSPSAGQSGQPSSQTVHPTPSQGQTSQPANGSQGNRGQNGSGQPGGGRQFGGGNQPTAQPSTQTATPASGQGNHGNPVPNGSNQPGSGRQFGSGRPSQPSTQTVTPSGGQPSGRQFGGGSGSNSGQSSGTYNSGRFGSNSGRQGATNQVVHTRNGGDVYRSSNGTIREVHTPGGAVIHHAPDGVRRVEVVRPGGRVVVASTHGGGYVQRPLIVNNRTYVQRTYIYGGVSYARVYRPYSWGGITFNVYTPYRYYRPAFYAYAYDPWYRPVYYSWGWGARPWYGYYGGWFTPYPVYASPSLWLTDYLIARTLEDAYQARVDARASMQANNYSDTPLTPEVKQAVADEVRRQLDQERNEQQNMNSAQAGGAPPLFSRNGPQVFVVSAALSLNSSAGECVVTEGDVLQMNGAPPQNATYADVMVLASKGRDCRKGSMVSVSLNDLQEMQNQMRATIDQGLGDLQSKQGQGGLPALPQGAAAPPQDVFGNQVRPDANASSELSQVAQEADRAEQDVVNQSQDSQGTSTVSLGMTTSEVEQILGRPKDIANVGVKKIYVYKDMKIIFMDGKVSDVQ